MAVDCHFHVVGAESRYPLHPARGYTPPPASTADWRAVLGPLGITHGVIVQPSVYGTDNRALLDALAEGGERLVGVGAVAVDVGDDTLAALATAGVRGLRFAHFAPGDPRMMPGFVPLQALPRLAPRMREHRLHADLFTDSRLLHDIAPTLRAAGLPVVLDHMGRTPAALGVAHDGMPLLDRVLGEGWCWVKLSGLANVSSDAPGYEDARPMHAWLVDRHLDRLVWGSDWPHTRPNGAAPPTRTLFDLFEAWTPAAADRSRILVGNPHALYRFARATPP